MGEINNWDEEEKGKTWRVRQEERKEEDENSIVLIYFFLCVCVCVCLLCVLWCRMKESWWLLSRCLTRRRW